MASLQPSAIREILKVTARPDIISFAGGLPAPELFPTEDVRKAADRVLAQSGRAALQYGTSEGYLPLREWIVDELGRRGIQSSVPEILVTVGSQQVLDLAGKLFIDPGDAVLTENPTYLAAIQAFRVFEARLVPVPTDGQGLIPKALPALIRKHRPKFLYAIPNFQNPTGVTLSARRREALAQLAADYRLPVVEDDPYGKLRFRGTDVLPVRHWDEAGRVIYASTFSKTIAPGLRLGWLAAPREVVEKLLILKQAADLHTSSFDQRVVYAYLNGSAVGAHLERIRTAYGERYAAMGAALRAEMPAGYRWTRPEGGMFLWVTGPAALDALELLERAVKVRVAFVPGRDFFPGGRGANHFRLNFSNCTPERIREGVRRLGALCRSL